MNIIWQGKDITDYVMVRKAVARDTCGGRCDGLDIEFENAESWYRWGPAEDDEIRVKQDGWDSGILYLNTGAPGNGKYRVLATALPCKAREKRWDSFENKTIEEILRRCAARTGMDFRIYGIDSECRVPYIQQEDECCAAFLHRLATLEGARMKCINGRYALIGLDWAAQGTDRAHTVRSALEIPAWRERLETIHRWYAAGYINPDAAVTESMPRSPSRCPRQTIPKLSIASSVNRSYCRAHRS